MDSCPDVVSAEPPASLEPQRKTVYERLGVFIHIKTNVNGEETHVPGRLVLQEVNSEGFVEWTPVTPADYADDEQGWALVDNSSGQERDTEYDHLTITFNLADVVSVTRAEAVLELPHMIFEFCEDGMTATVLYFHATSPAEFWQCLNRYLVLARCASNPNLYRVEGRTDALAKSLHGLNFSAEDSQGLVSTFFSTGVEVLGGFSRVTQFVRSQLGGQDLSLDETTESAVDVNVPAVDVSVPAVDVNVPAVSTTGSGEEDATSSIVSLGSATGSILASVLPQESTVGGVAQAQTSSVSLQSTDVSMSQPDQSLVPTVEEATASVRPGSVSEVVLDSLASASPCPIVSPTATLTSSVVPQTSDESTADSVVVTEPTSSISAPCVQQSPATSSMDAEPAVATSSTEDVGDVMFLSARSIVASELQDDPVLLTELPGDHAHSLSPSMITQPGATLVDLDGYLSREDPVTMAEWKMHLDTAGRVRNVGQLRRRVFKGGISPDVRPIIWKYLLGFHSFNATHQEQDQEVSRKREQYFALQQQWQTMFPGQLKRFTLMERRLEIIGKDVIRTDRTHPLFAAENGPYLKTLEGILRSYCMYNFDLGYVQGMSDLLSPILAVMDDEVDAFWCFSGLMDMVEDNFCEDMRGMRLQLEKLLVLLKVLDPFLAQHLQKTGSDNMFFCFRWLLVYFKREFLFGDVQRLWEVLWSRYLSPSFELFLAAAILTQQRQVILGMKMDSNDIITHINGLAEEMDLDMMLVEAERLCRNVLAKPIETLPVELRSLLPARELNEVDTSV